MHNYRNIFFFLALLLYALFFVGYIAFSYTEDKSRIIKQIDKELYSTATTLPLLLPKNFHHQNMLSTDYTNSESLEYTKVLSKFIAQTNVETLYSIVEHNGSYYYTTASSNDKAMKGQRDLIYYFDAYDKNYFSYSKIQQHEKVVYEDMLNEEDGFRTVSIRMQSEDGKEYIVVAQISLKQLKIILHNALNKLLYFVAPIVLLMLVYLVLGVYFHLRLERLVESRTSEISKLNKLDGLTRFPNRKALIEVLDNRFNTHLALMNIDGFQIVNDLYGNKVGDKLLVELSRLLAVFVDEENIQFFKLHGDEFAFVGTKEMREYDFLLLMERFISQVGEQEFEIDENKIKVMVSVGVASMNSTPLISANIALKEARKTNKNIYLYESHLDISAELAHNQEIIGLIHEAIENKKVLPFFQAIYSTKDQCVEKYESLMRLEKSDRTVMVPYDFLDIAHQTKLYDKLSAMMLEAVLEKALANPNRNFSFNLSASDIEDRSRRESIIRSIQHANVSHQLTLEILETEGFSSYKVLAEFISEVKACGVKVAIDDFGSGYSNFAEVVGLNIDYLKIDGSLVRDVLHNSDYEHIIAAIISFGHSLNLEIIAEFIENEMIAKKLELMGVDMLQGYYIGKPTVSCD
jgi:c-di-GMP phosphodiesterase